LSGPRSSRRRLTRRRPRPAGLPSVAEERCLERATLRGQVGIGGGFEEGVEIAVGTGAREPATVGVGGRLVHRVDRGERLAVVEPDAVSASYSVTDSLTSAIVSFVG
jgi:hypothetical protein